MLASGSSGNAAIVRDAPTGRSVLIDCGICKSAFFSRCAEVEVDPLEIEAVLVTHAHTDHTQGLGVTTRGLAQQGCRPALYAHPWTRACSQKINETAKTVEQRDITHGESIVLAGATVTTVLTSHDSDGSTCFRFELEDDAIGFVTDTGIITPEIHAALADVRILAIESNHDETMLKKGPYPFYLKQRILGSEGHLSNRQCCEEVALLLHPGLEHVIAMHVSEHNNTFDLPASELRKTLSAHGHDAAVHVARPDKAIRIS